MRLQEIDWRFSSTKCIFQALSDGLKGVGRALEEAKESYQVDDVLEHTESLLGIAFVMAQTYIAGTVSDINRLSKAGGKVKKEQLLKDYSDCMAGSASTKMELCDAIANYFKHHDEWENSSAIGRNQKTVSILRAAGIQENEQFPCRKTADLLWANNDKPDLEPLLTLISNWRKAAIIAYK